MHDDTVSAAGPFVTAPRSGGGLLEDRLPRTAGVRAAAARLAGVNLAALVVHGPSDDIVVVSGPAAHLMSPRAEVLGHRLRQFSDRSDSTVRKLFAAGEIGSMQMRRTLVRGEERLPVLVSVRPFERCPQRDFGLLTLQRLRPTAAHDGGGATPEDDEAAASHPPVIGSCDRRLRIQQIGSPPQAPLGGSAAELIGRPFDSLFSEEDRAGAVSALEQAAAFQRVVSLYVTTAGIAGESGESGQACELILLPQHAPPSCTFVLLPTGVRLPQLAATHSISSVLGRLARLRIAADDAGSVGPATLQSVAGWSRLTPREIAVVTRLVQGDRVPAIARSMYLSQSTVRSHVAAAAAKLGVADQQALIDLFRA